MLKFNAIGRASLGTALAATLAAGFAATVPARASAQTASAVAPSDEITLSVGTGRMMRLDRAITDLFVANEGIADVNVRSPNQIYIFGKAAGSTTVYATDRAGRVVYSTNVRVGQNLGSVGELLDLAMPEADIQATPLNGMVLLTGTVAQPTDAEEAERLVQTFVGEATQVISRLRLATPQQVMLKVTIAEVSRSLTRRLGVNIDSLDPSGGSTGFVFGRGGEVGEFGEDGGFSFVRPEGTSNAGLLLRNIFGVDVAGAVNASENTGLVTILAEPTLTALSGETASFLAGGEFPIPISQALGAISVEYRQFGVGLAFSPIVLENGRISMRVRPEVSELTSEGAVTLSNIEIPALTTRRAETTVELGSGQSFVIAGLLRNTGNNGFERTPFLGNLPIIGALFRSNNFRRNETELVIVVTPYLVRPVSASQISLPTDGYRHANDPQRILIGRDHDSLTGEQRPVPVMSAPQTVTTPGIDGISSAAPVPGPAPAQLAQTSALPAPQTGTSAQPGFGF
ncbi:type II and III secretion system protein family protein [Sphingosinicella sp. CPCC 101087]|uniref:type II and III secretion system protein family protein n=1 Tax=Sphingosinicella sp. CPCC 101087 TaxID=2497754 RepID=UPI00101C4ABE|nr:type II and III secretion system protein family protein [Sphingosinicella sp. CPCC 101087]